MSIQFGKCISCPVNSIFHQFMTIVLIIRCYLEAFLHVIGHQPKYGFPKWNGELRFILIWLTMSLSQQPLDILKACYMSC